jgi:IclR family acetate operon transcriptional repressor
MEVPVETPIAAVAEALAVQEDERLRNRRDTGVRAVRTALRVFEEVAATEPIGLRQLATRLGMAPSSAHRVLHTLHDAGWLAPAAPGSKRWVTAPRVAAMLGGRLCQLAEESRPLLEDLAGRTGRLAWVSVPADGGLLVVTCVGDLDVPRPRAGTSEPIVSSAAGWALLAATPEPMQLVVSQPDLAVSISGGEPRPLAEARRRGYAVHDDDWGRGLNGLGVAVLDEHRMPVAALGVTGPRGSGNVDMSALANDALAAADQLAGLASRR